jgi:predicted Zn-dependent peptidase
VLEDNLYLKKNLQVARHQLDLLQQQLADERALNQELLDRNTALSDTHAHLQRRTQMQAAEQGREAAALGGQVDELKELIERKQQ